MTPPTPPDTTKTDPAPPPDPPWGRVRIETTPAVLATLRACAANASAPADVRAAAANAADAAEAAAAPAEATAEAAAAAAAAAPSTIPWRLVQRACECSGGDPAAARHIRELVVGAPGQGAAEGAAHLLLPTPPPPRPRPPELTRRLEKLKDMLEEQRYAAALKDASPAEAAEVLRQMRRRAAEGDPDDDDDNNSTDGPAAALLPTTRLQLSFGLQVIVTMGAFFALGYYGGKSATGGSEAAGALLGTLGIVAALVLETSLFVVRSSPRLRAIDKKYGHLMQRKERKEEEVSEGEVGVAAAGSAAAAAAAAGGSAAGGGGIRQRTGRRRAAKA